MSRRSGRLLWMLGALVLLALGGLEWGLRRFAPLSDSFPYRPSLRYHRFLPSWNVWGEPPRTFSWDPGPLLGVSRGERVVSFNRFGFLFNEDRLRRRSPVERRIAVLGGSTVESIALRHEDRWTARLELGLQKRWSGTDVSVLNMGVSAQGARTHIATLAQLIVHVDIDAVIILLGANETLRANPDYRLLGDAGSFGQLRSGGDPRLFFTRWQIGRRFRAAYKRVLGRTAAAYYAETRVANAGLPVLEESPKVGAETLAAFSADVVSLAALAQSHGIRVFFLTQPMLWRGDLSPDELNLCWMLRFETGGRAYRLAPAAAAHLLEAFNHELMRVGQEKGYPVLDLARLVPRSAEYFYDDVHFNDAGARLVAERVAAFVGPDLGSQPPPARSD